MQPQLQPQPQELSESWPPSHRVVGMETYTGQPLVEPETPLFRMDRMEESPLSEEPPQQRRRQQQDWLLQQYISGNPHFIGGGTPRRPVYAWGRGGVQTKNRSKVTFAPVWQREKDSNPHIQSQSLLCYPYTIPLFGLALSPSAGVIIANLRKKSRGNFKKIKNFLAGGGAAKLSRFEGYQQKVKYGIIPLYY